MNSVKSGGARHVLATAQTPFGDGDGGNAVGGYTRGGGISDVVTPSLCDLCGLCLRPGTRRSGRRIEWATRTSRRRPRACGGSVVLSRTRGTLQ